MSELPGALFCSFGYRLNRKVEKMYGESRIELHQQYPDFTGEQIELMLCCQFSSEICAKLSKPSDWAKDARTLLSDLRHLETWRSEISSGNPRCGEAFTIHREKGTLFIELRGQVQRMVREIRAVQAVTSLPVSADRLKALWQNLEAVEHATDDGSDETQNAAYTVWRILKDETQTLAIFCELSSNEPDDPGDGCSNPWKLARDADSKITIADQMMLLFKRDDSIVDRKNLSAEVAKILGCSSQAVRHADNASWKYYQAEQARRKELRQALKGKNSPQYRNGQRLAKSAEEDADD